MDRRLFMKILGAGTATVPFANMIVPWYYIPRGFDLPMREDIRRKLDGGLPPAPPFKFFK